jgi:hypothetical protein
LLRYDRVVESAEREKEEIVKLKIDFKEKERMLLEEKLVMIA